ncbi:SsgA family sporulation/cell division regulator [Streptomyces sp. NBC_00335]|uniref:SsgA family sporulation/cell division regulator n=1 Tax=unclassified Streptomyces TaxID=2593676 RepID=UPI002255B986|nr:MULTISPECIES: SsgA family sporulation/cell division regulator [unclassified Streptomyces]MCX5403099.1 SsgA family sporulation/cell division regulator [Streptomyces sp. NBC_00086]
MSRVSALIVVRLETATGHVYFLARFAYDGGDPYVVQAEFLDGDNVLARWHFDRQMLAEGLHRPVGEGDVAFRPDKGSGRDELRVELIGMSADQQDNAVVLVDALALRNFLDDTYAVVAAGEEFLDLDKLLDELLAR